MLLRQESHFLHKGDDISFINGSLWLAVSPFTLSFATVPLLGCTQAEKNSWTADVFLRFDTNLKGKAAIEWKIVTVPLLGYTQAEKIL